MSPRLLPALMCLALSSCTVAHGLQVSKVVGGGMLYTVATVDLNRDQLQLHWLNPGTNQPYRTFEQLQARLNKQGVEVLFATNSGIYASGPKPLGLHIENRRTLVKVNNARSGGNFALLPNGVFWVKGKQAGVMETQAFKGSGLAPEFATQSGPLLLRGGQLHPQFNQGSTSFKLRSGVGVCQDGTIKFAISAGVVNFYQFAVFFRDTLKCPDALYLDGSISAYATPDTNTQLMDFAGIWTVSR